MNNSQPPLTSNTPRRPPAIEAAPQRFTDDDVALGCECADPALQIERWVQEAPQPLREFLSSCKS